MANSTTHASLPYPIRHARYSLAVAFRVAAGTPTDPSTPDTEISTDGGASFADTAEEITTGGSNGAGYLTLTGAETNNPLVWIAAKSANCLTTPVVLQPRNLAIVGSGTLSAGSAGGGTLGTLLAYDVTGCFIRTTGGTGGGGTGGANNQARRIITYNTSTGAFTVSPNWETTPSTDTTYDVLLPEGVTLGMLRALNPATPGRQANVFSDGSVEAGTGSAKVDATNPVPANATQWGGVAVASANVLIDGAITAAKIASDAITAAKIQDAALTAAKFASGAFDAVWSVTARTLTAFDASFKTGYALSSAGVQAIWDAATSALTAAGSVGKMLVDNVNATISSRSSHSAADVWAVGTRTLSSFGTLVSDIASAVWSAGSRTLTAFGFSVTVGTNNDKTGYTLHGDYDAAKTAAQAGDEMDLVDAPNSTAVAAIQGDPVYHADISLLVDEANTQDEYTVTWFKNAVPQTSGITSPLIQVVKRVDGTDLVAEAAMTQIGSTGAYKHDEDTNRITNGEAVVVVVKATIDGSQRTWRKPLGRDATS